MRVSLRTSSQFLTDFVDFTSSLNYSNIVHIEIRIKIVSHVYITIILSAFD